MIEMAKMFEIFELAEMVEICSLLNISEFSFVLIIVEISLVFFGGWGGNYQKLSKWCKNDTCW